jgi:UDP-N-acetylglucosamine pyrophosphorylase
MSPATDYTLKRQTLMHACMHSQVVCFMLLYCRSLIEVRSGKSFIDIIVEHIEVLNFRYGTNILLILVTSDNTDEPLSQV